MKQRVVFGLLVVFTIWPLVHFQLVAAYDLDPWKYGGWAMYVVADQVPTLETWAHVEGEWRPLNVDAWPTESRELARLFLLERQSRGERLVPQPLGLSLLRSNRRFKQVRIQVGDFSLDPDSGHVRIRPHVYEYARSPGA